MITRRRLVLALGAGGFAPLSGLAQQRKVWRIGLLREAAQSVLHHSVPRRSPIPRLLRPVQLDTFIWLGIEKKSNLRLRCTKLHRALQTRKSN